MARFEISDTTAGFGNIGYVHAAPQIVKLNDGRTALLVANGVASATGVSSLFVIDAPSGARLAEIAAGYPGRLTVLEGDALAVDPWPQLRAPVRIVVHGFIPGGHHRHQQPGGAQCHHCPDVGDLVLGRSHGSPGYRVSFTQVAGEP